jgi:hypothetical protein
MDQAANIHVAQEIVRRSGQGTYAYLSDSAQSARLNGDIDAGALLRWLA